MFGCVSSDFGGFIEGWGFLLFFLGGDGIVLDWACHSIYFAVFLFFGVGQMEKSILGAVGGVGVGPALKVRVNRWRHAARAFVFMVLAVVVLGGVCFGGVESGLSGTYHVGQCLQGDLNGDGEFDFDDLALMAEKRLAGT